MAEVLTKALSKENLAYYDTNVRPQQVKDVEVEGSQLKITKRDGSTSNLDLPSGGSFKYNTNKRYTTIYLTEDALKSLGYTGFEDSKTLLKYRTQVGTINTYISDSYPYGSPSTTERSYRTNLEDLKDGYSSETRYWDTAVGFSVSNPYTRVNILERKIVNYLPDLSELFLDNRFQEIATENDFNTKYINASDNYMIGIVTLFDSEGHQKAYFKSYTQNYTNYLDEHGFSNIIDAWIGGIKDKSGYPGISGLRSSILDNFAEGDTALFTVYTNSYSDSAYSSNPMNDDNIEEWKTNIKISRPDAMTFELYTYEDFQNLVEPIEVEVLPIQVPAKYEEYTNTYLTEQMPTPTTFNLYAFAVNFSGNGDTDVVRIVGQNIGNGIIVGDKFKYICNVEGDNECGVTTFTEVYPE